MLVEGLVSTIIPVHNRPALLREAVASVLAQIYRPIEIIIVDDGSKDETGSQADALAEAHPRFARSIVRMAALARRARRAGSRRAANSFSTSIAMISCCRQNSSSKLLACGNQGFQSLLWKAADSIGERPMMCHGSGPESGFPRCFHRFEIALVGYIDPPLSAGGDRSGRPMDRTEERRGLGDDCRVARNGGRLHYCDVFVSNQRLPSDLT